MDSDGGLDQCSVSGLCVLAHRGWSSGDEEKGEYEESSDEHLVCRLEICVLDALLDAMESGM